MSKNQKTVDVPYKSKVEPAAPKNPRSDRIQKSHTRKTLAADHPVSIAGRVDRGHLTSPFEVRSISKRTGELITTRHQTLEKAYAAAQGRQAHHIHIRIRDNSSTANEQVEQIEEVSAETSVSVEAPVETVLEVAA